MEKNKDFDFVFIVLVYRNTQDLVEFFKSFDIKSSKVIVVNSYYDEETKEIFKRIAEENNADFLNVPNNGYGSGNNRGIEYAKNNYLFKFLIVCNSDIKILQLSIQNIIPNVINAPKIITKRGRNQNPHIPYYSKLIDYFKFKILQSKRVRFIYLPIAINKLSKGLFKLLSKFYTRCIFAPHGAFIIFPYDFINIVSPLFNEKMFLFCEEDHIGMMARKFNCKICYNPKIVIYHKTDGSIGLEKNFKIFEHIRNSTISYYEYWYKK